MIDADAFAVLIADWCLEVQPGQQILVETTTLAQELASALHGAILPAPGSRRPENLLDERGSRQRRLLAGQPANLIQGIDPYVHQRPASTVLLRQPPKPRLRTEAERARK